MKERIFFDAKAAAATIDSYKQALNTLNVLLEEVKNIGVKVKEPEILFSADKLIMVASEQLETEANKFQFAVSKQMIKANFPMVKDKLITICNQVDKALSGKDRSYFIVRSGHFILSDGFEEAIEEYHSTYLENERQKAVYTKAVEAKKLLDELRGLVKGNMQDIKVIAMNNRFSIDSVITISDEDYSFKIDTDAIKYF